MLAVMALVACPFCRELFERTETTTCPVCGLAVQALHTLPLSHDAVVEEPAITIPEQATLPFLYWQRGRGALVLLSVVGIALFFMPWVHMRIPYERHLSGFHLASIQGWSWGPFVSWMVLLPMVLSRRSIVKLRGARVAAAFLTLVPAATASILLLRPQRDVAYMPVRFTYEWPLWAVIGVSVVGLFFAARLGGSFGPQTQAVGRSGNEHLH